MVPHKKDNSHTIQNIGMVAVLIAVLFGVTQMMDTVRDVDRLVVYIDSQKDHLDEIDAHIEEFKDIKSGLVAHEDDDLEEFREVSKRQVLISEQLKHLEEGQKFLMQEMIKINRQPSITKEVSQE
jgi:cell division protein FtsX